MELKHMEIKNFKAIRDMEIDFSKQFNLIIGNNGVGKTSILDAISVGLGGFVCGVEGVYSKHFLKDDVRRENVKMGDASYYVDHKVPVEVVCSVVLNNQEHSWIRRKKSLHASRSTVEPRDITKVAQKMVADSEGILPIINYQGAARMWGKDKGNKRAFTKEKRSRTTGYVDCLSADANNKLLISWCARMEQISWQEDKKITEYEVAKQTVAKFMGKMTKTNVSKVMYDKKTEELMYRENETYLPISYLSSGYQALIWLVFDIAYRMSVLNPNLMEGIVEQTPGIVLIDEIDVHLHPNWQWQVIEALQETFPKVQFIATTHSPIVLASCKDVNIIAITADGEIDYKQSSYGLSVNTTLSHYQHSTDLAKEVKDDLETFDDYLAENKLKEAREVLERLVNELGENNPSVVSALVELNLEEMDIEW